MRNIKILTAQDHVLVFIECTEDSDEVTCINRTTNLRSFPAPFTAFGLSGIFRQFLKDANGEWQISRTSSSPEILFRTGDIDAGTVSISNTSVLAVLPKKREVLTKWINTFGKSEVNTAIDVSRDAYITISEGTVIRKMDANTFIELETSIDDDIEFQ